MDGLRDQESIERITMMERQATHARGM
jgi:hypothetical protein